MDKNSNQHLAQQIAAAAILQEAARLAGASDNGKANVIVSDFFIKKAADAYQLALAEVRLKGI